MSKKTISDKLSEILTIKEEIKDSISNKEVDIDDNTPFRQYPSKINTD